MVKIREGLDGLSLLSLIRGLTFLQPQTDFVFSTCPRPNCPRVRWAAAEGKKDGDWNFEICKTFCLSCCFPGGSDGKESACNAGNPDSISGSGRSLGERNGNPLQYCLENPMDTGAWWAIVHGFAELDTTEQLTLSLSLFFHYFAWQRYNTTTKKQIPQGFWCPHVSCLSSIPHTFEEEERRERSLKKQFFQYKQSSNALFAS